MDLGDNELTLTPIPGKSGKAYMGSYPDGKRIFVKMNTSPILPTVLDIFFTPFKFNTYLV